MLNNERVRFLVAAEGQRSSDMQRFRLIGQSGGPTAYAHLDCLFVSAAHRRGGIGRKLLTDTKTVALLEGVDRMEWQTPVWNEQAIRFYRRERADSQNKSRFVMPLA
ncbi:GNAT family N-acetyltransferase (plasmid) [Aliirhizobium terrae]|uniref:GNAT family N-acetyltransferase n=1 Tax=Terrirhizobium terrae TaxID=2926709 RepID=UPI002574E8A1|nr:GNAT family N-acetyltransferase [Rhizobium sp. CC-CFT758]WJH38222.1 GNAT family N-acetyltransferase [Rhizobium sp. CC-CFT758]